MTIRTNPDSWLTPRRLLAHATVLTVCLWSVYLWTLTTPGLRDRNGNLKGTDFLHFYTLGSLAMEHRGADLYDMNAQAALAEHRVPEAAGIRYLPLYPPQVSLFFLPLAHLSYRWALVVWWIFTTLLYCACCFKIWEACPHLRNHGSVVGIAALGFPGFFNLITWGQTSALALVCFTLMFFCLRDRHEFLAGIFLGCLIFKPQLGLAAAVVFLSIGAWKMVAGAALSAATQLGIGVAYYGPEPLREWVRRLTAVRSILPWLEPRPYQTHSLRTFWSMLIAWPMPASGLYVLSAVLVLALTIAVWKHTPPVPLSLRYSVLLLTSVLIAPHLTVYDLVILAPAFLLLADWMTGKPAQSRPRSFGTLLYLLYVLPLLAPLVRWTHVQYSVIAMGAVVCVIYARSRESVSGENCAPGAQSI